LAHRQIEEAIGDHDFDRRPVESRGDRIGQIAEAGLDDGLHCGGQVRTVIGEHWGAGTHVWPPGGGVGVDPETIVETPAAQPIPYRGEFGELTGVGELGQNTAIGR